MKFGKSLIRVVELSNPEWGQYWINYKFLKRKLNEMTKSRGIIKTKKSSDDLSSVEASSPNPSQSTSNNSSTLHSGIHNSALKFHAGAVVNSIVIDNAVNESAINNSTSIIAPVISNVGSNPLEIAKSKSEIEFFLLIRKELKKASDFFSTAEKEFDVRWNRIDESYEMLQQPTVVYDKNTWTRLLMACVKFYKDVLMLENFAIMNYCGFSKILKKHDKMTGFITREAFMRNVMNKQNITHYPNVLKLISKSEELFRKIQSMESVMPLQDEERLFIEAIRDLNYQASRMQAQHNNTVPVNSSANFGSDKAAQALLNATKSYDDGNILITSPAGSSSELGAPGSASSVLAMQRHNIVHDDDEDEVDEEHKASVSLEKATNAAVLASIRLNPDKHNLVMDLIQQQHRLSSPRSNTFGVSPSSGSRAVVAVVAAALSPNIRKRLDEEAFGPSSSTSASVPTVIDLHDGESDSVGHIDKRSKLM